MIQGHSFNFGLVGAVLDPGILAFIKFLKKICVYVGTCMEVEQRAVSSFSCHMGSSDETQVVRLSSRSLPTKPSRGPIVTILNNKPCDFHSTLD